ncbi:MAG TPA: DUF4838 domain-containing protein [Armatimonadetes bacterium]|nr:DUF4838 domain-containing protein [Armatimonadota bacterium]
MFILALAISAVGGAPFPLVKEGVPQATIVVPAQATAAERNAAQELQTYLRKITGATLPLLSEGTSDGADSPEGPDSTVHVGGTDLVRRLDLGWERLDPDGFVLKPVGSALVLCGARDYSTEFAVYHFLQTVGGVRWFMPTELGEVVPHRPTFLVPPLDEVQEPDFKSRLYSGLRPSIGPLWAKRNKMRGRYRFHHNLLRVLPPSRFGADHPEYFPLVNGQRRVPSSDNDHAWQPCMSHPEVVQIAAQAARNFFAAHPEEVSFSLGINDSNVYCQCARCQALDVPGATFRDRPNKSDRVFSFMNAVAEELMRTHPDKYLGCLAYSWCEAVPTRVRIHPHIIPYLTNDRAQWRDPDFQAEDKALLRAWARAVPTFAIYDYYYGSGYVTPRVHTQTIVESLRFCRAVGVSGFYAELYPNWGLDGPKAWLTAQLLWAVEQDPQALLDDYYRRFFGPAAGPMRRFYTRCEEAWMNQPGKAHWFKGFFDARQLEAFPPELVAELSSHLRQAARLAADEERVRRRVKFVQTAFGYTERFADLYWASKRLLEMAVRSRASWREALRWAERTLRAKERLDRYYAEVIEPDPLQKPRIPFFERARWDPTSSVVGVLTKAVDWALAHGEGEAVRADLRRWAAQPRSPLAETVQAFLKLLERQEELKNLLSNPGFEAVSGPVGGGEGVDWESTGTPPGWSRWQRPGTEATFHWDDTVAHGGRRSVKIQGSIAACYVTQVPVEPGERYYCSVYARRSRPRESEVKLLVQWKDAAGQWFSAPAQVSPLPADAVEEWEHLGVLFTVPEGAAFAVVTLVAYGLESDEAVWFDDAQLVHLPE